MSPQGWPGINSAARSPNLVRRLAHPFKAALYGITQQAIGGKGDAVHAGHVALDPFSIFNDVGQAICGVVPRRHTGGLGRY